MRFEFIEYEVRGNAIDQYEGTTAHPTGVFVDVPRNAMDEDIARTLKARGLIDRTVKSSAVLVEGDPEVALEGFYVLNPYSSQPTYRPAFRLERRQAGLKRRGSQLAGLGEIGMSKKLHKDVEFAVDDGRGHYSEYYGNVDEAVAAAFNVALAYGKANLDVIISSRAGAKAYGGDDAVEQYDEDPEASVFERFEVRVNALGRVP
jgi:hypothetical protein